MEIARETVFPWQYFSGLKGLGLSGAKEQVRCNVERRNPRQGLVPSLESGVLEMLLINFFNCRNTWHRSYHFNHFQVYGSASWSTFTGYVTITVHLQTFSSSPLKLQTIGHWLPVPPWPSPGHPLLNFVSLGLWLLGTSKRGSPTALAPWWLVNFT